MCLCVRGFIDSKHLKSFLPPAKLTVPFAENGWLEDVCFLLGIFPFLGTLVKFRGCKCIHQKFQNPYWLDSVGISNQKKDLKPYNPPAKSHTSHPVVSDQKCECPGRNFGKEKTPFFFAWNTRLKSLKSSQAPTFHICVRPQVFYITISLSKSHFCCLPK